MIFNILNRYINILYINRKSSLFVLLEKNWKCEHIVNTSVTNNEYMRDC